jgi:hypothetical protein
MTLTMVKGESEHRQWLLNFDSHASDSKHKSVAAVSGRTTSCEMKTLAVCLPQASLCGAVMVVGMIRRSGIIMSHDNDTAYDACIDNPLLKYLLYERP